jgi:hypothetical protein
MRRWRDLFPRNEKGVSNRAAEAVIDAATVYGAGRWYFNLHRDPNWKFADSYHEMDDRLHFEELLHNLLLYDHIMIDNTSVSWEFGDELLRIIDAVNAHAGNLHLSTASIAPASGLSPVADIVCRILRDTTSDPTSLTRLLNIKVPWYYYTELHHDWRRFERAAAQFGMNDSLIPLALFVYRGLCYSGYAHHVHKSSHFPCAYLASPGRLNALTPLLSQESMRQVNYPRTAYADLVDLLDLPERGYQFDHLGLDAAHLSGLSELMKDANPPTAMRKLYIIRTSEEGRSVRRKWADRLWSESSSCAVGASQSNVISGSTIYGSVNMVIRAAAAA